MDTKLLYFPSINPPINIWFKTAFLFYEQIMTIAPPNFLTNEKIKKSDEERFRGYAEWLRREGYMRRISSFDNSMDRKLFREKMTPTLNYIKENVQTYKDELNNGGEFILLEGKISSSIIDELDDLDLVIKNDHPNAFYPTDFEYIIPESIGQVFMYQLAVSLGELDYCVPSTDQLEYTFEIQEKNNPLLAEQKYMKVVMPQIFPIPLNLELEKLFEFKERFSKELKAYRQNLEIRLNKLEDVESSKLDSYLKKEVKELKGEISRLEELYKDAGIDELTFSDVSNIARVLGGVVVKSPGSAWRGIVGFFKRNLIPESKNPLTYPAMFNYKFKKENEV